MERVEIKLDDAELLNRFARMLRHADRPNLIMADVAEYLLESHEKRFKAGVSPSGDKWEPLADGSGRTPLNRTGIAASQFANESGDDFAAVFNTRTYMAPHQTGTDPYIIRPRLKKALHFNGRFATKVNHPGLKARPFLGFSSDDTTQIMAIFAAWLGDP